MLRAPTPSLHRPPHPTPHGAMDRARRHARQVSQGQGGQAACRLRHNVHRRRRARQGAPSARAHHPRTATRVRRALASHAQCACPWLASSPLTRLRLPSGAQDFSFATIRLAGHMVPTFQPAPSLAFFERFLGAKPL